MGEVQTCPNHEIYQMAMDILKTYYPQEDEDGEVIGDMTM